MRALAYKHASFLKKQALLLIVLAQLLFIINRPASALVKFDFERRAFYIPGVQVKDHSIFIEDGRYHIFFIKGNEKRFGHAVSPDLRHWEVLGDVLATGPQSYDETYIWAPFVLTYPPCPKYRLMFYTGVNRYIAQRTALAIATDINSWSKASDAFFTPFHGDTAWIEWSDTSWSNFRDPCIYMEGDTCYMVNTVKTKEGLGAISLHTSTDFFNWTDNGPLYVHDNWHAIESPFLTKANGKYRLFFTEEEVGGVSYMFSDSIRSGWDITKRMIIDSGHAAEITTLPDGKLLFSRHTSYIAPSGEIVSAIVLDTLRWSGDVPEIDREDSFSKNWEVLWGEAFIHQPVFGNNPSFRNDDTTQVGYEGNWWIGTYEAFAGPLSSTLPGSVQGDDAKGALRSRPFTITGWSMKLLVGGGMYPDSCYVALIDAGTGETIYKETGRNTDTMDERVWDLRPIRGRKVYIEIVDNCSSYFGHINVDLIVETNERISDAGGSATSLPDKGTRSIKLSSRSEKRQGVNSESNLSCYPNPFNPATTIEYSIPPGHVAEIKIFDVSGKRIRRIAPEDDRASSGSAVWDGKDERGNMVPSGIYVVCLTMDGKVTKKVKAVLLR